MLSTKEITKNVQRNQNYIKGRFLKSQKKKKRVKKQSNWQGSSVAKFRMLRIFATLPNSIVSSFSSAFLFQMSLEMIMHLRVRLGFVVFESAQRK